MARTGISAAAVVLAVWGAGCYGGMGGGSMIPINSGNLDDRFAPSGQIAFEYGVDPSMTKDFRGRPDLHPRIAAGVNNELIRTIGQSHTLGDTIGSHTLFYTVGVPISYTPVDTFSLLLTPAIGIASHGFENVEGSDAGFGWSAALGLRYLIEDYVYVRLEGRIAGSMADFGSYLFVPISLWIGAHASNVKL